MFKKNTPYIVTRGNDFLSKGDVFWMSDDGSMVVCPRKSDCFWEQGGWYDEENLEEFPEILDIEASVTDKFIFRKTPHSEGLIRNERRF